MNKRKVMTLCPGDDVTLSLKVKVEKLSILSIRVIEIDNPDVDDTIIEL